MAIRKGRVIEKTTPLQRVKGDIIMKCLELLEDAVLSAGDLLGAFLFSGYGASYGKITKEMMQRVMERERHEAQRQKEFAVRQRYYSMLYKLKKDGLIKEEQSKGGCVLAITPEGKKKLRLLRKNRQDNDLPSSHYEKEVGSNFTLVVFDVPERERRKRIWLRGALFHMGLTMIQKSVWMGKVKIPKQFLDDLLSAELTPYVEIFQITKTGTLHILGGNEG